MARATQVKTIRVTNSSGVALTGAAVELKRDLLVFGLTEIGNGYYKVDAIAPGQYAVFVEAVDTGQTVAVGAGELDRPDYENNPNSYMKTDSNGEPEWVTELEWADVVNTPTTIAGYGITDAVVPTGGVSQIQISNGTNLISYANFNYDGFTLNVADIVSSGDITASSGSLTVGVNATITGQTQSGSISSGTYTHSGNMTFSPNGGATQFTLSNTLADFGVSLRSDNIGSSSGDMLISRAGISHINLENGITRFYNDVIAEGDISLNSASVDILFNGGVIKPQVSQGEYIKVSNGLFEIDGGINGLNLLSDTSISDDNLFSLGYATDWADGPYTYAIQPLAGVGNTRIWTYSTSASSPITSAFVNNGASTHNIYADGSGTFLNGLNVTGDADVTGAVQASGNFIHENNGFQIGYNGSADRSYIAPRKSGTSVFTAELNYYHATNLWECETDFDVVNDFTAGTIQADNGFTGTGAYTNFTIVGGVITSAS